MYTRGYNRGARLPKDDLEELERGDDVAFRDIIQTL